MSENIEQSQQPTHRLSKAFQESVKDCLSEAVRSLWDEEMARLENDVNVRLNEFEEGVELCIYDRNSGEEWITMDLSKMVTDVIERMKVRVKVESNDLKEHIEECERMAVDFEKQAKRLRDEMDKIKLGQ